MPIQKKSMMNINQALVAQMLFCLLVVPGLAQAQMLINADMAVLQPTISRDEKGFKSCGVRAVVLVGDQFTGQSYDFSVNVYGDSFAGMVKAGKYMNSANRTNSGDQKLIPVLPGPTGFWISTAAQGIPLQPSKFIPADSDGFILGAAQIVPAFKVMMDMARGERMQFATQYKNETHESVIAFSAAMEQKDLDALMSCSKGIHQRMTKAASQRATKK